MKKILLFCGVLSVFAASSALASSFYVEKVRSTGLDGDDANALQELVKGEVPRQGSHSLATKAGGADYVLSIKVMRLGKSYLLTLDKLDSSGNVRFTSQLKVLEVDEFDTVAKRLVRSVLNEVPIKGDAQIGEVTQNEAKLQLKRQPTNKYWLVGFGPSTLTGLGVQGVSYSLYAGFEWDIENTAGARIFYSGNYNASVAGLSELGLGGSYFFSEKSTAPLISGEFSFAGAHNHSGNDITGFGLGVAPAVRFFRTSRVNIQVQLRYSVVLRQLDGLTPQTFGLQCLLMF
ncbi:MAG: hypothetical protein HY074_13270 [Deltaproteobacteria bacterium]|nr:hypothetical protein [Deltaproteobacteria bacterium]